MFAVGDLVCYPMHGIGTVEAVEEQSVLGETTQYYLLRFMTGRMTAMIPVASAGQVGLRPIADPKTCETVIEKLTDDRYEQEIENWNQRYRSNLDKLRVGKIHEVADVVKCLKRRDSQRGLSSGERKMYLTARQVLVTELSVSTGRPESELMKLVGDE